jgi:hypothetical protein
MKTAERRDQMVATVNATAAKWPTFAEMPEVETFKAQFKLAGDPAKSSAFYIEALYELCSRGTTPTGRAGDCVVGD